MQASRSSNSFQPSHIAVLLVGMLVFVLLFLADKSNLNDDSAEDLGSRATASESSNGNNSKTETDALLSIIPPANPSEDLAVKLTALEGSSQSDERVQLLRAIVEGFRDKGRIDVAAVYAGILAREAPEIKNLTVAGALFRNACRIPELQADTSAFRRFSDEALRFLGSALELEPDNENVKIELGLAMVEARKGAMSMQGILKIREVVEQNPENIEALFHLGKFSMDTGQFDKAEGRFRQILAIVPTHHTAKYFLGIAVQQLKKDAEFKQLMTEVAAQQDDPALAAKAAAALGK